VKPLIQKSKRRKNPHNVYLRISDSNYIFVLDESQRLGVPMSHVMNSAISEARYVAKAKAEKAKA